MSQSPGTSAPLAGDDSLLTACNPDAKLLFVYKDDDILSILQRLRAIPVHPTSSVGWWCTHPDDMTRLLPFLVDPFNVPCNIWTATRASVASQIAMCRHCAVAYHTALDQWHRVFARQASPDPATAKLLREHTNWTLQRLLPKLREGALASESVDPSVLERRRSNCRAAFLEALLSERITSEDKFSSLISAVFLRHTPADNANDLMPFISDTQTFPKGLINLCFHSKPVVQSWAQRAFKMAYPSNAINVTSFSNSLNCALAAIAKHMSNASAADDEHPLSSAVLPALVAGFGFIWQIVHPSWCSSFVRNSQHDIVGMFVNILQLDDCKIASFAAKALNRLFAKVDARTLFPRVELNITPFKRVFDSIMRSFRVPHRLSIVREALVKLVVEMLNVAVVSISRGCITRLYNYCLYEMECILEELGKNKTDGGSGVISEQAVQLTESRSHVINAMTVILTKFCVHAVPKHPFEDLGQFSEMVLTCTREAPLKVGSWDLLKTVLLRDVVNLIYCVLPPSDATSIMKMFANDMKRRNPDDSFDPLHFCLVQPSQPTRMVTFCSGLWNEVRNGRHLRGVDTSTVLLPELKTFLDLHLLIGFADLTRVNSVLTDEHLNGVQWQSESCKREGRNYLCNSISLIQDTIAKRISVGLNAISPDEMKSADLGFHSSHILSSGNRQVANDATTTLQRLVHSKGGLKPMGAIRKILANYLKSETRMKERVAEGFAIFASISSSWGNALSMGAHARFFLWHRALVEAKFDDTRILQDCCRNMVSLILSFATSWKLYEKDLGEAFLEVCDRFFRNVQDIWKTLVGTTCLKSEADSPFDISFLTHHAARELVDMHSVEAVQNRAAWVACVAMLGPALKRFPPLRSTIVSVVKRAIQDRAYLNLGQCRQLANSFDAPELHAGLSKWESDQIQRKKEQQAQRSALAAKKSGLVLTRIDSFFTRKDGPSTVPTASTSGGVGVQASVKSLSKKLVAGPSSSTKLSIAAGIQKAPRASASQKLKLSELASNFAASTKDAPKPSSRIAEMRAEVRQAAKEASHIRSAKDTRTASKPVPPQPPTRTKFELIREAKQAEAALRRQEREKEFDAAEKQVSKARGASRRLLRMSEGGDSAMYANLGAIPRTTGIPASAAGDSHKQLPALDNLKLPESLRYVEFHSLDAAYRSALIRDDGSISRANHEFVYSSTNGRIFSNADTYLRFWQPLLIDECRASIEKAEMKEESHAKKHGDDHRAEFQVSETVDSVGVRHILSLEMLPRDRTKTDLTKDEEFEVMKIHNADIVRLEIPPVHPNEQVVVMRGMAMGLTVHRGQVSLKINVSFPSLDRAPGVGRKVRVCRLVAMTSFQRQVETLRDICRLPDGILWPLLNPLQGIRKMSKVTKILANGEQTHLAAPLSLVAKLRETNALNVSQSDAVEGVIRSCGSLFKRQERLSSRDQMTGQHANDGELPFADYGGMSLIQGPPGTGKTKTIVGLLSALLCNREARSRKSIPVADGESLVVEGPSLRVLVCAPSNAAVDELMKRVGEHGLLREDGEMHRPQVVRVGGGTTMEALKKLELRSLARRATEKQCESVDEEINAKIAERKECIAALQKVNHKIGEVDRSKRSMQSLLDEARAKGEMPIPKLQEMEAEFRILRNQLSTLHREKNNLNATLDQNRQAEREAEERKRKVDDRAVAEILNTSEVVFATLSSSGHELVKKFGPVFDVVIVDEAAQCVEPDIVIPLTVGRRSRTDANTFAHLVLVGDPRQLPATVLSVNPLVTASLGKSLFERLAEKCPSAVHMLKTQYRMHPKIAEFPNRQFYSGQLSNGECVLAQEQAFHSDIHGRFGPLTFIDTSQAPWKEYGAEGGSKMNRGEANLVIDAIVALIRGYPSMDFTDKIIILSPYRGQVELLQRLVRVHPVVGRVKVEVTTVDGIQGREKPIVFMSTVRAGNARDVGFVKDVRRLNVAITRAQQSVIVMGHADVLSSHSSIWHDLVSHCRETGCLKELSSNPRDLFSECGKGGSRRGGSKPDKPDNVTVSDSANPGKKRGRSALTTKCCDEGSPKRKRQSVDTMQDVMDVDSISSGEGNGHANLGRDAKADGVDNDAQQPHVCKEGTFSAVREQNVVGSRSDIKRGGADLPVDALDKKRLRHGNPSSQQNTSGSALGLEKVAPVDMVGHSAGRGRGERLQENGASSSKAECDDVVVVSEVLVTKGSTRKPKTQPELGIRNKGVEKVRVRRGGRDREIGGVIGKHVTPYPKSSATSGPSHNASLSNGEEGGLRDSSKSVAPEHCSNAAKEPGNGPQREGFHAGTGASSLNETRSGSRMSEYPFGRHPALPRATHPPTTNVDDLPSVPRRGARRANSTAGPALDGGTGVATSQETWRRGSSQGATDMSTSGKGKLGREVMDVGESGNVRMDGGGFRGELRGDGWKGRSNSGNGLRNIPSRGSRHSTRDNVGRSVVPALRSVPVSGSDTRTGTRTQSGAGSSHSTRRDEESQRRYSPSEIYSGVVMGVRRVTAVQSSGHESLPPVPRLANRGNGDGVERGRPVQVGRNERGTGGHSGGGHRGGRVAVGASQAPRQPAASGNGRGRGAPGSFSLEDSARNLMRTNEIARRAMF